MVKNCPNVRGQGMGNGKTHPSVPITEAPKRNHFYALKTRDEQENSPDVVRSTLQVFSINVYALLDPGSSLLLLHLWYLGSSMYFPMFLLNAFWFIPQSLTMWLQNESMGNIM